jgi:hypothetical protein
VRFKEPSFDNDRPLLEKMKNFTQTPMPRNKVLLHQTGGSYQEGANYRSLIAERAPYIENQDLQIDPEAYLDT